MDHKLHKHVDSLSVVASPSSAPSSAEKMLPKWLLDELAGLIIPRRQAGVYPSGTCEESSSCLERKGLRVGKGLSRLCPPGCWGGRGAPSVTVFISLSQGSHPSKRLVALSDSREHWPREGDREESGCVRELAEHT